MSLRRPPRMWTGLVERRLRAGRPFGLLDVGSRKLCCYIVRLGTSGRFELLGAGHQAADGFEAGEVVNAAAAEAAMRAVIDEAERMADERLRRIAVTFAGGAPASGYVKVEVSLEGRPVTRRDVTEALRHAGEAMTADGFSILHAVPLGLALDGGPEVRDVTGVPGRRLTVRAHLVGVAERPLRQLGGCLERCHLELETVVVAPYAAALACITKDEAERGVMVVDCGARTTSLAVFHHGQLQFVAAVPFGADQLTDELAACLNVSQATAERLKNLDASVEERACDAIETVEITPLDAFSSLDTVEVPKRRLTDILRPVSTAILEAVSDQLIHAPVAVQAAARRGVVLTGGGAQQEGLIDLAMQVLSASGVRIGRPDVLDGWSDPPAAAASGALALVAGHDGGIGYAPKRPQPSALGKPFERVGQWLRESLGVT
ncbi:MAG: cell division protein FtsA [Geminicoccaceae bacterium]|nr:MAG: cell division protein FtsA [Geminicoccaceae bacterium]